MDWDRLLFQPNEFGELQKFGIEMGLKKLNSTSKISQNQIHSAIAVDVEDFGIELIALCTFPALASNNIHLPVKGSPSHS